MSERAEQPRHGVREGGYEHRRQRRMTNVASGFRGDLRIVRDFAYP